MLFFLSQEMMFRYIWNFKKMRIFKNKIIFWGALQSGGIIEVPQISRIHTDFFFEVFAIWDMNEARRSRR